jgi:hypothetical protein
MPQNMFLKNEKSKYVTACIKKANRQDTKYFLRNN